MTFKKVIGTFIFTDIVQSSKLWRKHKNNMSKAIEKHEKIVERIAKKNKGIIVKSLGDSFMLFFKGKTSYNNAFNFSREFMCAIRNKPIKLGSDKINFRIGGAYGDALQHASMIQGKKLCDFFGNAVNLASRMESVVAGKGEIAISFYNEKKWNPSHEHEIRDYRKGCKIPRNRKRSERLITSYSCFLPEKLKGAKPVKVYVFKECQLT